MQMDHQAAVRVGVTSHGTSKHFNTDASRIFSPQRLESRLRLCASLVWASRRRAENSWAVAHSRDRIESDEAAEGVGGEGGRGVSPLSLIAGGLRDLAARIITGRMRVKRSGRYRPVVVQVESSEVLGR